MIHLYCTSLLSWEEFTPQKMAKLLKKSIYVPIQIYTDSMIQTPTGREDNRVKDIKKYLSEFLHQKLWNLIKS